MNENKLSYEDCCRIVGELYLTAQTQNLQAKSLIDKLVKEIAGLKEENRRKENKYEVCNTPNENI